MKDALRQKIRSIKGGASAHPPEDGSRVAPNQNGLDILDGAQAFGLWLILERIMDSEKSAGGIVLPESVRTKPAWVVRSVGEKVSIPVKVGDHVVYDGARILEGKDQRGNARAFAFAMEGQVFGKLNPAALTNVILTSRSGS